MGFLADPASRRLRKMLAQPHSRKASGLSFVEAAPCDLLLGRCSLRAALAQVLSSPARPGAEALLLIGAHEALPGHGKALLATLVAEARAKAVARLEVPDARLRPWLDRLADPLLRGVPLGEALASASRDLELPEPEVFEGATGALRDAGTGPASRGTAVPATQAARAFAYYPRLERVRSHVETHLSGPITVRDAARLAHLEVKYFSTYFHAKTGVCFRDWLARVRVDRAAEMIRWRDESITDVAYRVGFNDLRTFERAFKRRFGTTPAAMRRAVRSEPQLRRDR